MRFELVANLIESMDFAQFREFARNCILQRGYTATQSDGWSDGGRDLRVYTSQGAIARNIAFQTSVERDWKSKIVIDFIKAKEKLGCRDFTYITNRRIGDAVFDPLVQKALTEQGVHLHKIDNQDLAAQMIDFDKLGWFASFLKLPAGETSEVPASLRTEVADAFILFSNDADDFRDKISEHAVVVALLHRGQMKSRDLISTSAEILSFEDENRFRASVDRLQQSGVIVNHKGSFSLCEEIADQYIANQRMVDADREQYRIALKECLLHYVSGSSSEIDSAVEAIENLLGTLIRRYADYQVSILQDSNEANDIRQEYGNQVRCLEAEINAIGVPLDRVKEFIERVNTIAQEHPVVTRLVAGDVFRRLLPCARSALLNAFGRVKGIQAFLEPTVVIPLLCSKLFKDTTGNRYLRAAQWFHERASALRVNFMVPDIYLEECAVHLITAGRYTNVLHSVGPQELSYSENAFVAYYSSLVSLGKPIPQYKEFLELFGFAATGEFRSRLRSVQAKLRRLLRNYNVEVVDVRRYRSDSLIKEGAEQDLDHIYHVHGVDRPSTLQRHDTRMLAFIRDQANQGNSAQLLVTWDNSMQLACRSDDYEWWCIDPLHAGDLMALVEPGKQGALGVDVALLLDDAHLKLASKLWDTIVRIERDDMYDADLIQRAVKFRNEFLERQKSDTVASQQIVESWKEASKEVDFSLDKI